MNQTEIPRLSSLRENCSSQNLPKTYCISKPKVGFTTLSSRDQQKQYLNSTNQQQTQMSREKSTKGIKVVFSASDRESHQFKNGKDAFSLKIMNEQLLKMNKMYEQKINKELSYNKEMMNIEVERLKDLLTMNEIKLLKKDNEIKQLTSKVEKITKKAQKKISKLETQIFQLQSYYQRCNDYTFSRISDIEARIGSIFQHINEQTINHERATFVNQIQYINDLIQSIIVKESSKTVIIKFQLQEKLKQLYQKLKNNHQCIESLNITIDQLKSVKYSNETFSEQLDQLRIYIQKLHQSEIESNQNQKQEQFNRKYSAVLGKINSLQIEVKLIGSTYEKMKNQEEERNAEVISQLSTMINELQKNNQKMKEEYENKLKQNPQILYLEEKLKLTEEQIRSSEKQIANLTMKLAYFQKRNDNQKLQHQCRKHTRDIEELKIEKNLLIQEIAQFQYQQKLHLQQITQLQIRIEGLSLQNMGLNDELQKKSQILQNLSEQMEEETKAHKIQQLKKQNGILKEDIKNLQSQLHEYAVTFQNQSTIFINTIENLQIQKQQLSKQNANLKEDLETTSLENMLVSEEKYNRLKKTIQGRKEKLPLTCQIDETGYLKDERTGTYIVDQHENLFQLTGGQLSLAMSKGLIRMIQ